MLTWRGHRARVRSLSFSPDNRYIATTAGESKFVWVWDISTRKPVHKFTEHDYSPLRFCAFFPDGKHIIGLCEWHRAYVWELETGNLVKQIQTPDWVPHEWLALNPDGSRLLIGVDAALAEWKNPCTEPNEKHDTVHAVRLRYPHCFGFSPKGTYFWNAGLHLDLMDSALKNVLRTFRDPRGANAGLCAFTPDESRLAVVSGHRAATYKLTEPRPVGVQLRGHTQSVRAIGFLPDGTTVLTAAMDGSVRLWDADTGSELRAFDWGIGKIRVAAVSHDGTLCAAGSDDGEIVVWDVD
jgi:WD40 repeat protein